MGTSQEKPDLGFFPPCFVAALQGLGIGRSEHAVRNRATCFPAIIVGVLLTYATGSGTNASKARHWENTPLGDIASSRLFKIQESKHLGLFLLLDSVLLTGALLFTPILSSECGLESVTVAALGAGRLHTAVLVH
eukprot:2969487-Amphidinium_carterae.1